MLYFNLILESLVASRPKGKTTNAAGRIENILPPLKTKYVGGSISIAGIMKFDIPQRTSTYQAFIHAILPVYLVHSNTRI